jgi:arsenate reductase
MAEAFLNEFGNQYFLAQSAGIEPGNLNSIVVEAMNEIGIDISQNATKSVDLMLQSGQLFDFVITVCDETSAERCPIFPGPGKRMHWGFKDPSAFIGSHDEKLRQTILVRDAIRTQVIKFIQEQAN